MPVHVTSNNEVNKKYGNQGIDGVLYFNIIRRWAAVLRGTPEFNSPHCDVTWWKREMATVTASHSNQQVFIIHVDYADTPEHTSKTITASD